MSISEFNRMLGAFDLVEKTPDCFLTIHPTFGLTVTKKSEIQASCDDIIVHLCRSLLHFSRQSIFEGEIPKNKIKPLKEKALSFLKAKITKHSPAYYDCKALKNTFFPIAQAKWDLERGFANAVKIVEEGDSLIGQKILDNPPKKLSHQDLKIIAYPRDLLFIEKQMLLHLKERTIVMLEVANRVNKWIGSGYNVFFLFPESSTQGIFYEIASDNDLDQELVQQVKRACTMLARKGLEGLGDGILKKLAAYSLQLNHNPQLLEQCLQLLETNELYSIYSKLTQDWRKVEYTADGLTSVSTTKKFFETQSYLPRRRLDYLLDLGYGLDSCSSISSNQESILQCFTRLQTVYSLASDLLTSFEKRMLDDTALYTLLADRINEASGASMKNLTRHEQITFRSSDLPYWDPNYEEYSWKNTGKEYYVKTVTAIQELSGKLPATVRNLFKEYACRPQVAKTAKGFVEDIALPKRIAVKRSVKRKPPSQSPPVSENSSRSSSPETLEVPPHIEIPIQIEKLTASVASLTLTKFQAEMPRVNPKKQLKASPPAKEQEAEIISTGLKYDIRVLRWFRDKDILTTDPEYTHTKYGKKAAKWIYFDHSFARIADLFFNYAVVDTNKKNLEQYGAVAERRQLIGDVTMQFKKSKVTTKGAFTLSKNDAGLTVHRLFSNTFRSGEIIDTGYAAQAWAILEKAGMPAPLAVKPKQMAKDLSYVESQTEELIVIFDPKNNARIRLVKRLP